MSKPTRLSISYNEKIRFSYTVDKDNQCLHVKLGRGVPEDFMRDAINEAYDHYNSLHRDAEFIHPSAVVLMDEAFEQIGYIGGRQIGKMKKLQEMKKQLGLTGVPDMLKKFENRESEADFQKRIEHLKKQNR